MKRSVAVVVVLLAVVGCSKAKPKAEPAAQPAAKPPTCAEAAGAVVVVGHAGITSTCRLTPSPTLAVDTPSSSCRVR